MYHLIVAIFVEMPICLLQQNSYRLNGLALANIHKDISVEISQLVDTFVSTKPRRMVMSDWSGDE